MRRPVGVIVAAVVLGFMTLFWLIAVVFALIGTFFLHHATVPTGAVSPGGPVFTVVFNVTSLCILTLSAWTVVDLVRLRPWARYSIIALGILTAVLFGMIAVITNLMPKFVPLQTAVPGSPVPPHFKVVLLIMSLFFAGIALIGVWWAVYFNLRHVRQAFAGTVVQGAATASRSEFGPWHGVVTAMAILMLVGGVSVLGMARSHLPFLFFSVVLRGNHAMVALLLMGALQLFIGIGLLRRMRTAYWAAIIWQVYGILGAALYLIPSFRIRVAALYTESAQHLWIASHQPPQLILPASILLLFSAAAVPFFLVSLYALVRCRRWFAAQPM
jgi:hypothetical protein